jgi:hypothetical protein
VKIQGDSHHCFPHVQCKLELYFQPPMNYDCLTIMVHIWSHYIIKLTNMASVYIVFPCHACECGNCLSTDHLFLHFSQTDQSFSSVFFKEYVLMPCSCCQLYYFPYAFQFIPTNAVLLWPVE